MRRYGIPQPPFRIEDAFSQTLAAQYRAMFDGLVKFLEGIAGQHGYRMRQTEEGSVMVEDADPRSIMHALMDLMGERGPDVERLRNRLNAQLVAAERSFFQDMMGDADRETARLLISMSLPKRAVFNDRIVGLRGLYLDQAVERIEGEQDDLKKRFLQHLIDWAEGKTDRLYVTRLLDEMKETSARRARFFARDQFSRFNRALLVTTYEQAGADFYEWLTVGDNRVRPVPGTKPAPGSYMGLPLGNHRVRNHKIYTLRGLLDDPEYKSFNDRCGYAPIYGPLTEAQKRRFVA